MTMDRVIQGTAHLGQATIQWQNVAIIAISAIIMALVYMLLEKTFVGNIMQATAQDQYMASLTGVPVIVSIGLTFALSAMITGIGEDCWRLFSSLIIQWEPPPAPRLLPLLS